MTGGKVNLKSKWAFLENTSPVYGLFLVIVDKIYSR